MSDDPTRALHQLVDDLRARGVDVGHLPALEDELVQLQEPPGLFHRVSQAVRGFAARQWEHLQGELSESQEVLGLLARRLRGEALSPEERDAVASQIGDWLRMLPAGAVVLALEAIPVPGTSVATPWLLSRLGLMPSRWREAHLLAQLQAEAGRLRGQHQDAAAARVEALITAISDEARCREQAAHRADLASLWDTDGDGVLGPEEQAAYDAALEHLAALAGERAAERRWYLRYRGTVFGPIRLSELGKVEHDAPLLVCFDGGGAAVGGWVELDLLLERS